jgi:3,2-trans-enoyl-CoA isomerase
MGTETTEGFIQLAKADGIGTLSLQRGKVNALNEVLIEELAASLQQLEADPEIKAVILTGTGKFFSFGFDIPEFLNYAPADFIRYLEKFTGLYASMFMFPKPLIAALNGHTIAGACMLATACDFRLMVAGKAKISLNEITFGSSVFAGSAEMLRFLVGNRHAQTILYDGAMFSAAEASSLGLIDRVVPEEDLVAAARQVAMQFAQKEARVFSSIKHLLRQPIAAAMQAREMESIKEVTEIWYSEKTWKNLQKIQIHS